MKTFVMKSDECAALRRAEREFLGWRAMLPTPDKTRLAKLGEAARAFLRAWDAARPRGQVSPELAQLLAHMERSEFCRAEQRHYVQQLEVAEEVLLLVDSSCRALVRAGVGASEDSRFWVWCAATQWHAAGLTPSATERGRFSKALSAYCGDPSIPRVTASTLKRALEGWRKGVRTA